MRIQILSVSSLFVLIVIVSGLLGFCGLDLFIQIVSLHDDPSGTIKFLLILGSSCVVLILASVTILSARKYRIKSALNSIPHLFMPINESDMPTPLYRAVQKKLADSITLRLAIKPLPEDRHMDGFGRIDGQLVHFKTAMSKTLILLSGTVSEIFPHLVYTNHMPLPQYFQLLKNHRFPFDESLADAFSARYDAFSNSPNEATELEYLEFMKLFALLLRSMEAAF
ncbi:hypothetical protein HDU98_002571 [Podochytrium sp. JEL0797]|nr:hypothetical protein HDU98_002571 [Podochytrium sp. JEL0797]